MLLPLIPAALALDIAPYQQVLDSRLDARGRVDYTAIGRGDELGGFVEALATDPVPTSPDGAKAFWINAYNALTINLIADSGAISSVLDLDNGEVWGTRHFTVAGREMTLNDIEHRTLRLLGDPRAHAALNCASLGCPPLSAHAFSRQGLDAQLDEATRHWARTTAVHVDRATNTVQLNHIFDWYAEDFAATQGAIPGLDDAPLRATLFVAVYLPEADARWLRAGGYQASWAPYDWKLNRQ